ncbi:hypothetical protein AB0N97_40145 [Streptomyces collinus]|uniref:hypothetical protein n=1 Tax=Streptomyces collinus TaxID=42684 RepID=UPI003431F421
MTMILTAALSDLLQSTGHELPDIVCVLQLCAALVNLTVNVDRAVHTWSSRKQNQK